TDAVFENGKEANNVAEAPNFFDVVPIPYADLVVSSVVAPPQASSGQPLRVTWTVTNQSPHAIGTTNLGEWSDAIALASDPAGNPIVAPVDGLDHAGALAIGGSYTHTADVVLPNGLSGTYYVVVRTGGPYEFIYGDNDAAVSGAVAVTLTPPPDLTPTQLLATTPGSTAELTTAQAGDKIDITWTVQNIGPGAAVGLWYADVHRREWAGPRHFGLGQFDYATPLPAGKAYTRAEQLQLPTNIQGIFQLVVTTNPLHQFFEDGAYDNNTLIDPDPMTLTIPPH